MLFTHCCRIWAPYHTAYKNKKNTESKVAEFQVGAIIQNDESLQMTVDGSETLHQLRLVVHPIIYKVLMRSRRRAGFLKHQQEMS